MNGGIVETVVIELVKTVPALVVLVYVVHRFLVHLKSREVMERSIAADCHIVISEGTAAIKENSRVLGRVETVISNCQARGGGS